MDIALPALTFRGASVLHDGALDAGEIAIRGRRIAARGPVSVDLDGYLILPGAIDIGGEAVGGPDRRAAALCRDAAEAGVTTVWAEVRWPDDGPTDDALEQIAELGEIARTSPVDLRVRLLASSHAIATGAALVETVRRGICDLVVFRHPPQRDRLLAEVAFGGAGPVARHLCSLASAFDAAGIRYASTGDSDGETRESFAMFGARMILRPGARPAAATARAMGDPVVLAAADIVSDRAVTSGLGAALLAEGLCDALASFGAATAPLDTLRVLVEAGRLPLAHAWRLLSSGPAGIMGLADRGVLAEGRRADLAILDAATLTVAGTVASGRLVHATQPLMARLAPVLAVRGLAAE